MTPGVTIRDETDGDIAAITEVTVAAFATMELSNQTEHHIVVSPDATRRPRERMHRPQIAA